MADEYDYGGGYDYNPPVYDYGSMYNAPPSSYDSAGYNSPAPYDYSNLPSSDPASSSWRPEYNPISSFDPRSLPSGSGAYQVGQGEVKQIYSPGGVERYNYTPSTYQNLNYTPPRQSTDIDRSASALWAEQASRGSPRGGFGSQPTGGGGGPGGNSGQAMQRLNMGSPERALYDRYKEQLLNPEGMAQDPAYKFLYNQGLQTMNRSLAAKGLMNSGKSLNDSMAYGQGMSSDYMNKMLPQYQAGAREELARFMGPAGLAPSYANTNNQATQVEGSSRASAELLPYYRDMLGGGGASAPSAGIGYGGVSGGYTPQARLQQQWNQPSQQVASADSFDISDLMDRMDPG